MSDTGTPDPAALSYVLRRIRRVMDETEGSEQHAVLVTDPQTGSRSVIGPYPNRLHARVAAQLIKARNDKADPELADLTYEVVLSFPPEGSR